MQAHGFLAAQVATLKEQAKLYSGATVVIQMSSRPFIASWLLLPRCAWHAPGKPQPSRCCNMHSGAPASRHGAKLLAWLAVCRRAVVLQLVVRPKPFHEAQLALAQQMVSALLLY